MSAKKNSQADVTHEEQPEIIPETPAEGQPALTYETAAKKQDMEKSAPAVNQEERLKTVAAWAAVKNLASWQLAALSRCKSWAQDKQVSEAGFDQALSATLKRGQGGDGWAK